MRMIPHRIENNEALLVGQEVETVPETVNKSKSRASPNKRKANPPGMRITERDYEILMMLLSLKLLDLELIAARFFSNSSNSQRGRLEAARRRMRLGFDHRLWNRHRLPTITGEQSFVYTLGAAGRDLLIKKFGRDPNLVKRAYKYSPRFKPLFAYHLLDVNRFRLVLDMISSEEIQVVKYMDEAELKFKQIEAHKQAKDNNEPVQYWVPFYTDGKNDGLVRLSYPDGYFVLSWPGSEKADLPIYFEIDRGTTTSSRWRKRKIKAYQNYRQSGWFSHLYGYDDYIVLTLTTSEARKRHLVEATTAEVADELKTEAWQLTFNLLKDKWEREPTQEEVEQALAPDGHFWFTTLDNVSLKYPSRIIEEKVWHTAVSNIKARLNSGSNKPPGKKAVGLEKRVSSPQNNVEASEGLRKF